jgi:hypothetical protein
MARLDWGPEVKRGSGNDVVCAIACGAWEVTVNCAAGTLPFLPLAATGLNAPQSSRRTPNARGVTLRGFERSDRNLFRFAIGRLRFFISASQLHCYLRRAGRGAGTYANWSHRS